MLLARWKIAVINPGMIFGPPLFKRADSESVQLMKSIVGGLMWFGAPNMGIGVVDIRDVAAGHCMAMANKEACGRYVIPFLPLKVIHSLGVKEIAPSCEAGLRTVNPGRCIDSVVVLVQICFVLDCRSDALTSWFLLVWQAHSGIKFI